MGKVKNKADLQVENAELRGELRALRGYDRRLTIASIVNTLVICGTIGWIADLGYRSVEALAGRETNAKIDWSVDVNTAAPWLGTALGVIYGVRQKKLRKDSISHIAKRTTYLESKIDPQRTSSGLTLRGDTNPLDA